MARITRLGAYGGPRPLSEVAVTRLGMYGGPRPLYASFAGNVSSGEVLISQARSVHRFIFSRIHGRVN